ncbi:response regulator transcription factor [Bacillus sp. 03113]|uniref:response regulator transcription factor n=1 Tax=Bacillus sp. 03113 TaxID=2578211 RepID=UPI001144AA52|nr:response regulator transcription factor [Bacillus sp. 03113]
MKLLLAEDDRRLAQLLIHLLKKNYYTVEWVEDGVVAFDYASTTHYDVIILDWMLPNTDGVSISQNLRKTGYQGAILMLTARDTLEDRLAGFDAGVDDYLVKPFEFQELIARIKALTRRNYYQLQEEVIEISNLKINLKEHCVQKNGQLISLTTREFQLLEIFVHHPGHVLTRDFILEKVWGFDSDVTFNTLEVYIKLLRKKLEDPSTKQIYIRTVRGVGYQWVNDVV